MDNRKVFQELVRGREFAHQLRQVINNGKEDDDSSTPLAQSLMKNILKSFTNSLFLLDKFPTNQSHEISQIQQREDSCLITPTKSQDSQESCKSFTSKNRRGCYKRKRTTQEWEEVMETPIVDGHQWRKYGQKAILNAKYSRNYYRCTHKYDQKCQAAKQVQRIQEEPPLYKTTYFGHHTCNDLFLNTNEIILDHSNDSPPNDTSMLLSFNNTFPTPTNQKCPFLSSVVNNEEVLIPSASSNDHHLVSPKPTLDDSSGHNNVILSPDDGWDIMSEILCDGDVYQPLLDF